jgi:hypothetical protein
MLLAAVFSITASATAQDAGVFVPKTAVEARTLGCIANRSAVSERVAQGNLSRFNGLDFYCRGSKPDALSS